MPPAPERTALELVRLAAAADVSGERFLRSKVLDAVSEQADAVVAICVATPCLSSTAPDVLRLPALVPLAR